jgi:hypothetical protein
LWKNFNSHVETVGNLWGKIRLKIRIAKNSKKRGGAGEMGR